MRNEFRKAIATVAMIWACGSAALAQQDAPSELGIDATIPVGAAHMAFGFESLWTMSEGDMVRIHLDNKGLTTIKVPESENAGLLMELDKYRGIAVGEDAIWVPDMASSRIYKIDPGQNEVVMEIVTDIFGSKGSIGVGEGSVWVITFEKRNKSVTRYDAVNGDVEASIDLPNISSGVLAAFGSVWVTAASRNELYRIDPTKNEIAATISTHGVSHLLAAADGSIWIPFDTEGVIQRIDGQTGEIIATIETGAVDMEADGDITSGGGFIWTINRRSIVAKIDPTTNEAIGLYRPPPHASTGRRIRYGDNSLWLSGNAIYRIELPH